jgi:hypothetical protein
MTKKHFKMLAEMLLQFKDELDPTTYEQLVSEMSAFCRMFNPRFETSLFRRACGVEE